MRLRKTRPRHVIAYVETRLSINLRLRSARPPCPGPRPTTDNGIMAHASSMLAALRRPSASVARATASIATDATPARRRRRTSAQSRSEAKPSKSSASTIATAPDRRAPRGSVALARRTTASADVSCCTTSRPKSSSEMHRSGERPLRSPSRFATAAQPPHTKPRTVSKGTPYVSGISEASRQPRTPAAPSPT